MTDTEVNILLERVTGIIEQMAERQLDLYKAVTIILKGQIDQENRLNTLEALQEMRN